MEIERNCIFCYSPQVNGISGIIDSTTKAQVAFSVLCSQLGLNLNRVDWNFNEIQSPPPLCVYCLENAFELEKLCSEIKSLQQKVLEKVEKYRDAIKNSNTNTYEDCPDDNSTNHATDKPLQNWSTIDLSVIQLECIDQAQVVSASKCKRPVVSERFRKFREQVLLGESSSTQLNEELDKRSGFEAGMVDETIPDKVTEPYMMRNAQRISIGLDEYSLPSIGSFQDCPLSPLSLRDLCEANVEPLSPLSHHFAVPEHRPIRTLGPSTFSEDSVSFCPPTPTLSMFDEQLFDDIFNENAEESSMSMKWEKKRDGNYFLGVRTVAEVDAIICKFPECDHSVPISKAHFKKIMGYHIKEKHFQYQKCPAVGCPKRFLNFQTSSLEKHLALDHQPKASTSSIPTPPSSPIHQICPKCNKVYKDSRSFKSHVIRCGENEANSSQNASRRNESEGVISYHTITRKLFTCQSCQKSFSKKTNLQRHMESHSKSLQERKGRICPECSKLFTKEGLTEHLRLVHKIGSPINTIKCSFTNCSKYFPSKSRLERHIKAIHTERIVEN